MRYFGKICQVVIFSGSVLFQTSMCQAVDLLEVFEIAQQNDPEFAAVSTSVKAIQERRAQAMALLLPNLSIDANSTYNNQEINSASGFGVSGDVNFNSRGYHLKFKQPLFRYDRWLALKQAGYQIKQSEAQLEAAYQTLIFRVAERYFNVLTAQDNVLYSQAEEAAYKRQLAQVTHQFEAGFVAEADVIEIDAAYNNSLAQVILAENDQENARESLREFVGTYSGALSQVSDHLPLLSPEPNKIEEWTRSALETNPEILMAQNVEEISKEEVGIQKSAHYPTLDLVASYGRDVQGGRFGPTDIDATTAGVQLNIPLYAGGLVKSKTVEAEYRYLEAEHRVEQKKRAVLRETRNAFLGIKSGISRVRALALSVESSVSAQQAILAGYEAGTRTTVDVVDAERELFRTRMAYSSARYDYILNILRLQKAAGLLDQLALQVVNAWLSQSGTSQAVPPQNE